MVVVDVDGAGEGTVHAGQGDGQAAGGSHIHHLIHEGEACRGSSGDGTGTGCLSADAGRHGAVLGFHGHILGVHLAVGHILGEVLRDLGGGGDGEGRHHVRVDLLHGKGDGLVAGETVVVIHTSPPSFMVMAPKEQTSAQMPQPLQW